MCTVVFLSVGLQSLNTVEVSLTFRQLWERRGGSDSLPSAPSHVAKSTFNLWLTNHREKYLNCFLPHYCLLKVERYQQIPFQKGGWKCVWIPPVPPSVPRVVERGSVPLQALLPLRQAQPDHVSPPQKGQSCSSIVQLAEVLRNADNSSWQSIRHFNTQFCADFCQ